MKKKAILIILVICLITNMAFVTPCEAAAKLNTTASKVLVDGKAVSFKTYKIGDSYYFKLKDLAYALSGTVKQFDIITDTALNAINIITGKPYTVGSGEISDVNSMNNNAAESNIKLYVENIEKPACAYSIGGNYYYKLQDIGKAIDFSVEWNKKSNAFTINTAQAYTELNKADISKAVKILNSLKLEKSQKEELTEAIKDGIVTPDLLQKLKNQVSAKTLYELLGKSITAVSGKKNADWSTKAAKASTKPLKREEAAQIIYAAAHDVLGINPANDQSPRKYLPDRCFKDELDSKYGPLTTDFNSLVYVCSISDPSTDLRLMECTQDGYFRYGDKMTVLEAIEASYRLTGAKLPFMSASITSLKPVKYIPVNETGTYDKAIITDALLNKKSSLPEASNSSLPYWTGFILENKIGVNEHPGLSEAWLPNSSGRSYFYEPLIKYISKEGFNCARILYSLSYLSNPDNMMEVNETQLKQLDELISWGLKYDVHIMISITGLPGKVKATRNEENVQSNSELFTNAELLNAYKAYMTALAKRYAAIPNRNLSFELLAEPAFPPAPDQVKLYCDTLAPVVQSMWEQSPGRILIANDVYRSVPEKLAEMGCCLSVHNNIFTTNSNMFTHLDYTAKWPMDYLPCVFNDNNQRLILKSSSGYNEGTVRMYLDTLVNQNNGTFVIAADGKVIKEITSSPQGWIEAALPKGTRELEFYIANGGMYLSYQGIVIEQKDRPKTTLVVHDIYTGASGKKMPSIQINDDGTTTYLDNYEVLNAEFLQREFLQKFIDCAKKYNVGFLMTEIGPMSRSLSEKDYFAYSNDLLTAVKNNKVSWMWINIDNFVSIKTRVTTIPIYNKDDLKQLKGTPLFEYKKVIEFLKKYQ